MNVQTEGGAPDPPEADARTGRSDPAPEASRLPETPAGMEAVTAHASASGPSPAEGPLSAELPDRDAEQEAGEEQQPREKQRPAGDGNVPLRARDELAQSDQPGPRG